MGFQSFGCSGLTSLLDIPNQNVSMLFDLALDILQSNLSLADANWELDSEYNPHLYTTRSCASIKFQVRLLFSLRHQSRV